MDYAFAPGDAAMRTLRIRLVRRLRQELAVGDRHITERSRMKPVTVKCPKGAEAGIAQPRRLFEHCVEYRARSSGELLITSNTSAAAVCCSRASRVSVMSRAFSIAMTACAAKFCNS